MIIINGELWRVRIVQPSYYILTQKTGLPAVGCCDDVTKTIYLSQSLSLLELRHVLCHELVHAAMYSYNIDLEDNIEEIVANIIADYGDEIIQLTNIVFDKLK